MPTELSNGVVIFNATPHELQFQMADGEVIVAKTDVVLNCKPLVQLEKTMKNYTLHSVVFQPTEEGQDLIRFVKENYPGVVIVGSLISAQAYPSLVATSVPVQGGRKRRNNKELYKPVRSDRFTIYPQKENQNG